MTSGNEQRLGKASGPARRLLALVAGLLASLALIVSGAGLASAQNVVGPQPVLSILTVGSHGTAAPDSVGVRGPPLRPIASATGVAADTAGTGGAAAVRMGQAGEAAVRGAYDIGPKATRVIGGRTRIFDGLNDTAVSEVKNVGYQAYTQQLKDSLAYAQENGLQFNLYVRGGVNPTTLSGPLRTAIGDTSGFNLETIP